MDFNSRKESVKGDDKSSSKTPHEVTYDIFLLDEKMTDFVQLMEDCSNEIDRAAKFTQIGGPPQKSTFLILILPIFWVTITPL